MIISESLLLTIIGGGITGAGLIFAAYSIIISFSEKIREFKQHRIEAAREKINGNKPVEELKKSIDEIEKLEEPPFYLSQFVYVIFLLYISSAMIALIYLLYPQGNEMLASTSVLAFGIATFLFGIMGISLLQDFLEFIREMFRITKLESKKEIKKKK